MLQLPTWDDAGYLGPYAVDKLGHIYVAPTPYVSLYINPPDKQNQVWKVDASSGLMTIWDGFSKEVPI